MPQPERNRETVLEDDSTVDDYDQDDNELSIDLPPESPVPKKGKKRKAKDSGKEKKSKKSKSISRQETPCFVEAVNEEGTDIEDEMVEFGMAADEDDVPSPATLPKEKRRRQSKRKEEANDTTLDDVYGDEAGGSGFAKPKKSKKSRTAKKKKGHIVVENVDTPDSTALETEFDGSIDPENDDSEYMSAEMSTKEKKRRQRKEKESPVDQVTSDEVCAKYNLNPVSLDYSEDDFRNLSSYRLFTHHVRPIVVRENPKVATTKVVQLLAAIWREFLNVNPYRDQIEKTAKKSKEVSDIGDESLDFAESEDGDQPSGKKDRSAKKTVAPLKIKINKKKKRRRGSDDEDNEGFNTSDEEFERQLEEAAMIEEQEKVEKSRKPKMKKGRGRNARKKKKVPTATLR